MAVRVEALDVVVASARGTVTGADAKAMAVRIEVASLVITVALDTGVAEEAVSGSSATSDSYCGCFLHSRSRVVAAVDDADGADDG